MHGILVNNPNTPTDPQASRKADALSVWIGEYMSLHGREPTYAEAQQWTLKNHPVVRAMAEALEWHAQRWAAHVNAGELPSTFIPTDESGKRERAAFLALAAYRKATSEEEG